MKVFILTICLLFSTSCGPIISQSVSKQAGPAEVKQRVMRLVQIQRQKKLWMKADECPADLLREKGRRPTLPTDACAANPSKCLADCDANGADSCYALARLIQDNDVIENDVADVLYRRACRLGIVSGCTNSAAKLFDTDDAMRLKCAARTFEVSCVSEDPWACAMRGLALAAGIGTNKDIKAAERALDRACEVSVDKAGTACTRAKELKALLSKPGN